MTQHMRILRPAAGILAYYDGRVAGQRFAAAANWVDDGALSLGIASYAIVDGDAALIYDTHISVAHARAIRRALTAAGVMRFSVVLSHWHLDHVAGTEAFADCEIIANVRTLEHLKAHQAAIESGTHDGPPGIVPLILPARTFDGTLSLNVGSIAVELHTFNIHSDDATVLYLPAQKLLLAGDTLEDTVTYVSEPEHLAAHLADLDRLEHLAATRILPNHGDPAIIAAGGYAPTLIDATRAYTERLQSRRLDADLRTAIAPELENGWVTWFAPYAVVHQQNIDRVAAL